MFSKETYIRRRQELKRLVGEGVVILFGNNESPYNYPANAYAPMRQDSSFLYYFGQHRDGLVGVIDIPSRSISVKLSDEELAARPQQPLKRNRVVSKALRAYAQSVSSADKGGIRIID